MLTTIRPIDHIDELHTSGPEAWDHLPVETIEELEEQLGLMVSSPVRNAGYAVRTALIQYGLLATIDINGKALWFVPRFCGDDWDELYDEGLELLLDQPPSSQEVQVITHAPVRTIWLDIRRAVVPAEARQLAARLIRAADQAEMAQLPASSEPLGRPQSHEEVIALLDDICGDR